MYFDQFKNKHQGERCFILGNSPSLQEESLSLLKDETVFIVNKGYRAIDIGLPKYDYYVCTDPRVYKECYQHLKNFVYTPKFYGSYIPDLLEYKTKPQEDFILIKNLCKSNNLLKDKFPQTYYSGWSETRTVIVDTSLIAYFMGFSRIYFLGVNLESYQTKSNHFYKDSEREKGTVQDMDKRNKDFYKIFNNLNCNFKKNNVHIVNLSKGFRYKDMIKTDSLDNIIGNV